MNRLISGIFPLLVFCSAYATEAKDPPIPTETNVIGIVIFGILFVGGCVGFFVYLWWVDKHKKQNEKPKA
jgi:hypothetical protein